MPSTPAQLRSQKPRRRRASGRGRARLRISPRARIAAACLALLVCLFAWAALERAFSPAGNTDAARVDAIIVLGASVDRDGNPTPVLLSRVSEGAREYERGVAPRIIMTGDASHGFAQAAIMARVAQAQGVPASAILQEPNADNTIQNACFAERIMKQHGWRSAEVVTSPSHLPRANLIFSRFPLQWRGHAAPYLSSDSAPPAETLLELAKTVRYLLYARWTDSCQP